jgi:G3E family GTPase
MRLPDIKTTGWSKPFSVLWAEFPQADTIARNEIEVDHIVSVLNEYVHL